MPVNEIEIPGTSLSLRCLQFKCEAFHELFPKIQEEGDQFSIDPEKFGFHDCDFDEQIVRGNFSMVVPFEVEHLVEGIVTKTLLKHIETCEFFALENVLFVTGKLGPQKILEHTLAGLTGYGVTAMEFEFRHLSQFQERLTTTKTVALTNPKDREVRRARLAGKMESYTEYNVIDSKNHGIESVSGLADTPLGPLNLTVSRKGIIRLNVKRGWIATTEFLQWVLALIREEKPPQNFFQKTSEDGRLGRSAPKNSNDQKHADRLQGMVKKMDANLKASGTTMTMKFNGKSASIGAKPANGDLLSLVEDVVKEAGIAFEKGAKIKV